MSIIQSRLDNDFYNFTMGYVVFEHYPDVEVEYSFTNRTTEVRLGDILDLGRLREEIEAVRRLEFQPAELQFLLQSGLTNEAYLSHLKHSKLPAVDVQVHDGQLHMTYKGNWADAIYWETPLLAIVSELYHEALMETGQLNREDVLAEGRQRHQGTVATLKANPAVKFIEFGARRRHSRDWQEEVVADLVAQVPNQIIGTSNVYLAYKLGIPASGTTAHQLTMVTSALHIAAGTPDPLVAAQNEVLDIWEQEFGDVRGGKLLVSLTDTYGTDFFLRNLTRDRANRLFGLRQDSGDAMERCQQLVDYYRAQGIDPLQHSVIPSDGLNVDKMVALTNRFGDQTQLVCGCGTFLTNNLSLATVSIVVKPKRANGHPTVKLSDNIAKAIGPERDIEEAKRFSGYDNTFNQTCIY